MSPFKILVLALIAVFAVASLAGFAFDNYGCAILALGWFLCELEK